MTSNTLCGIGSLGANIIPFHVTFIGNGILEAVGVNTFAFGDPLSTLVDFRAGCRCLRKWVVYVIMRLLLPLKDS